MSRARLGDVAEQAGVSLTTASMALSGKGRISEEVRQRVAGVARELGYRRRAAGPAVPRPFRFIGVLHHVDRSYEWSFIRPFILAIEATLIPEGYIPTDHPGHRRGRPAPALRAHPQLRGRGRVLHPLQRRGAVPPAGERGHHGLHPQQQQPAGPLLRGGGGRLPGRLRGGEPPDRPGAPQHPVRGVQPAGEPGRRHRPVRRLPQGARRAGHPLPRRPAGHPALRGLGRSCRRSCAAASPARSGPPPSSPTTTTWRRASWPPCASLGVSVPKDVSLIAPGDVLDYSQPFLPRITTLRINTALMSQLACRLLLDRLRDRGGEAHVVKIKQQLIDRGSCAPAPHRLPSRATAPGGPRRGRPPARSRSAVLHGGPRDLERARVPAPCAGSRSTGCRCTCGSSPRRPASSPPSWRCRQGRWRRCWATTCARPG